MPKSFLPSALLLGIVTSKMIFPQPTAAAAATKRVDTAAAKGLGMAATAEEDELLLASSKGSSIDRVRELFPGGIVLLLLLHSIAYGIPSMRHRSSSDNAGVFDGNQFANHLLQSSDGGSQEEESLSSSGSSSSSSPHVLARAGTNITLACPGVTPTSYIYLVEWKCLGCQCKDCPNPNGEGFRLMRYNDKLTRWDDEGEEGEDKKRRSLDFERYGIRFQPVRASDSGTYLCLLNNRREPDAPLVLTVQDVPDAPPSRPLVVRLDSRSVDLSWAPPRRSHHHPVLSYKIFIKEGESGSWSRSLDTGSNSTQYKVGELQPFTTYMFRVAAKNVLGHSEPSRESYPTMTHRELPSAAPQFLLDKVSTSSTSLSLVWQPPPVHTLNGEFLGYDLTYRPQSATQSAAMTVTINENSLGVQNYTIRSLQKHTSYIISLAAKNLKGVGPDAKIELRTEDGVPLEPRSPRFYNVSARSIGLSWQPPSNAANLGGDLLGYRLYLTEKCSSASNAANAADQEWSKSCKTIPPITINSGSVLEQVVTGLTPATKYRIVLRAFTKKREGPASDSLVVTTDSSAPGAPLLTNVSCHGNDEVMVTWRRPSSSDDGQKRRVEMDGGKLQQQQQPIRFYRIRLRSVGESSRKSANDLDVDVEIMNDTLRNVAFLSNLTADSAYDLTISAFVESLNRPGSFYEGPPSHPRRVLIGRECDPLLQQAFSKVPSALLEYNAGVLAGIVCTVTGLVLLVLVLLVCRRHKPRYEFLALTPKCTANGNGVLHGGGGGLGWRGDAESDIPLSLLPKHVRGLHAAGDMAFHKDFEAIHEANGQHRRQQQKGNNKAVSAAATTFPDIVNGGDCNPGLRTPYFVDGWMTEGSFVFLLCEAPFTMDSTWKAIWDQKVAIVVTLLTAVAKDDLSTLSDSKTFGDISVALQSEDILPDCTIRTMKLTHGKNRRRNNKPSQVQQVLNGGGNGEHRMVTQLIFSRWPEVGLPEDGQAFLDFVKASFSCRQSAASAGSKTLVHSRSGMDSCLVYASLETAVAQIFAQGDVNLPSYSRHLSATHDLALSSVDHYVFLHDVLAAAADKGQLHSVMLQVQLQEEEEEDDQV